VRHTNLHTLEPQSKQQKAICTEKKLHITQYWKKVNALLQLAVLYVQFVIMLRKSKC